MSIEVVGLAQLRSQLAEMGERFYIAAGNALRAEAEIEMTEAKQRTPVATGALRGSGHVTGPEHGLGEITVRLLFGGPAAPYALDVHENLEAFHRVGEAKFLERTVNEAVPHLPNRIARRIESEL